MPNQKRASVRARGQSALRTRRSLLTRFRERGGFTLIETIISVGLLLLVLSFALANYYRGGDDSVLNRETSLLMGRIRLAQEETASGQTLKYCSGATSTYWHFTSKKCQTDADCSVDHGNLCCPGQVNCAYHNSAGLPQPKIEAAGENRTLTSPGGYAMVFSCPAPLAFTKPTPNYHYPLIENAKVGYSTFADNMKCPGLTGTCIPAESVSDLQLEVADGLITYFDLYPLALLKTGMDTQIDRYTLSQNVELVDLRIVEEGTNVAFTCLNNDGKSPWATVASNYLPFLNKNVAIDDGYPLQGVIHFIPPDGRTIKISDGVSAISPVNAANPITNGKPWDSLSIMLKLKKRATDCQAVTITKSGAVSQALDTDCRF